MPIYEFKCLDCDISFETLVLDDNEEFKCKVCDSHNLEKQFSLFGVKSESGDITSTDIGSSGGGCCSPAGCGCHVRN